MAYKSKLFRDASGGVNQSVSRLLMADNEYSKIQNGELEKIGSVTKVRGYSQRGTSVNAGYSILGGIGAIKSNGTRKQIVIADGVSSSDAYTYNSTNNTWTPHGLSLSIGAQVEFEQFLDGFFMVNFSDVTRWNDFTQWYTTTNVTNAPKGKYIKQYLSRIYIGYVVDSGTTYPSRIIYSDLPSGTPLTIGWNNTFNYLDIDNDDGDVLMGMEVNANRLLAFKENSLHRYDTNSRYKVPGCPGTVSNRSIKNIEGWTLYLHSTGIWGYNGTESKLLSRKIQDIIEGISTRNFVTSCAYVKGDHYRLYLGDINNTRAGLTINNCEVDYDISKNAFTWKSIEKDPTIYFNYRDDRSGITYNSATVTYNSTDTTYDGLVSSETRYYFGTQDGGVYETDRSNSFDGNDIALTMETKDIYLDSPSLFKLLQKIIIYLNRVKSVMVQYKLDDGDWKTMGKTTKTQSELIFETAARCQRVKLRFLEMSSGGQFSIEGFDLFYTLESLIE